VCVLVVGGCANRTVGDFGKVSKRGGKMWVGMGGSKFKYVKKKIKWIKGGGMGSSKFLCVKNKYDKI